MATSRLVWVLMLELARAGTGGGTVNLFPPCMASWVERRTQPSPIYSPLLSGQSTANATPYSRVLQPAMAAFAHDQELLDKPEVGSLLRASPSFNARALRYRGPLCPSGLQQLGFAHLAARPSPARLPLRCRPQSKVRRRATTSPPSCTTSSPQPCRAHCRVTCCRAPPR